MPNPREVYFESLTGGIEIRTQFSIIPKFKSISVGTLGMLVYDNATGAPLGISNAHILRTGVGGLVYQPGITRRTKRRRGSKYVIGKIVRVNMRYDCGVFKINQEKRAVLEAHSFFGLEGKPNRVVPWEEGMKVKKIGKNTGWTYGIVKGVNPQNEKAIRIVPNPDKPADNNEISVGGDSGAIWLTDEAQFGVVGLHYAGEHPDINDEYASAFPADLIERVLKISFIKNE